MSFSSVCPSRSLPFPRGCRPIQRIVTRPGRVDVSGIGYQPEGELTVAGSPLGRGPLYDEVRVVVGAGSLASGPALTQEGGTWNPSHIPARGV